eukprot:2703007-Karenia_brevis.AAC.1
MDRACALIRPSQYWPVESQLEITCEMIAQGLSDEQITKLWQCAHYAAYHAGLPSTQLGQ